MRIAVLGLGAVGAVYACLLKKAGHEVWGLVRPEEQDELKELGLTVSGAWGRKRAMLDELSAQSTIGSDQKFDGLVVAVKSYDLSEELLRWAETARSEGGWVLLLQDGYGNYEKAAEVIPSRHIIMGQQSVEMLAENLGESQVMGPGEPLRIGSPEGIMPVVELEAVSALLTEAGIATVVEAGIMRYVWANIILHSAFSSFSAILQEPFGKLLSEEQSKVIVDDVIKEIYQVMELIGAQAIWPDREACQQELVVRDIGLYSPRKSLLLEDIRRGRPTEIDYFNGAICRLAQAHGIFTPCNEMLRTMLGHKIKLGFIATPATN